MYFPWRSLSPVLLSYLATYAMAVDYYPKGYFNSSDVTKVTWAHGVNSKKDLSDNLKNSSIQMLEADIVIGTLENSNEITVIMAHPHANTSDLSLAMFVDDIIEHNKKVSLSHRKGMKLDFKDMEAAKKGLPTIKTKLEEDSSQLEFPIWINADVLTGPVNASESKMSGPELIQLQKENVPNGTLSLGWTTRFGLQSDGDIIRTGNYSKEQFDEMAALIKTSHNSQNSSAEITFPLRAGIALNSVANIKRLLEESGIEFASPSVTLWEGGDDPPLEKEDLDRFIEIIGKERVFIDLPKSLGAPSAGISTTRGGLSNILNTLLVTLVVIGAANLNGI